MFFGIGAYGVAIASTRLGAGLGARRARAWSSRWCVSLVLSLVIGLFSLRVKAIFFAMITLAVAAAFQTLASQLSRLHRRRGRPDASRYPSVLQPGFEPFESPFLGAADRRQAASPTTCCSSAVVVLFLALLRIVNSPFGRVLQAIRENDFRAEAIGYRTVVYRTLSNVLVGAVRHAGRRAAGAVAALHRAGHHAVSFEIMLDILLIVVIGGMGTMYGAVIGAVLFVLAQNYLQDLLQARRSGALDGVPVLGALVSPDRWLLWLGVLFVLSVYHFPTGVVGRLRAARPARRRCMTHHLHLATTCAAPGRELHFTEWGARARRGRDRLARPGAHRARHGRHRRAPGAALPRDLPRHHRPRPEPVEPRARRASTAWPSTRSWPTALLDQLGIERCHWLGTSMGGAIGTAAPRPAALRGRIRAPGAQRHRPAAGRRRPSQRIRSYAGSPPAFATVSELEAVLPHRLQALRLAERRAVAAPDRDLDAPPARRPRDAALRPGDGACSSSHHPDDYAAVGGLGHARHAGAVPARRAAPTCCCPRWPRRCATAARARWWSRSPAAATRRR